MGISKDKAEKAQLAKKAREPGARAKKAEAAAASSGIHIYFMHFITHYNCS
jgi:hypothetical protein